jgi:hypothetical protein
MKSVSKLALATAAAALFSGAIAPVVHAEEGSVHCMGINACKGQSKCATAENACAGQNKCKGHGWLPVASAEECAAKGGTVAK